MEPPGAWGQRASIWLKVQLQQSRLPNCESRRKRALCPRRSWCRSRKQSRLGGPGQARPRVRSRVASLPERGRERHLGGGLLSPVHAPSRTNHTSYTLPSFAQSEAPCAFPLERGQSIETRAVPVLGSRRSVGNTISGRQCVRRGQSPETRASSLRNASPPSRLWGERVAAPHGQRSARTRPCHGQCRVTPVETSLSTSAAPSQTRPPPSVGGCHPRCHRSLPVGFHWRGFA